ncbi:hypothetical protein PILCRDRAFT_303804 [Piloderma croceum F 1598]|uniref:Uncharacterized protein n=1 Tax=Piloderma croceum (strain F 1598) TaxID=765440 RepID=A0A0C3G5Z9_PILCF|nr:hypothetical protein PILCRDRAFT_303804 [Piloderma croceum F 1598]
MLRPPMLRPPTPPPFQEPLFDENDPRGWFWDEDGGGHVLDFGQYKDDGKKLHDTSLSYLRFCRTNCSSGHLSTPLINIIRVWKQSRIPSMTALKFLLVGSIEAK